MFWLTDSCNFEVLLKYQVKGNLYIIDPNLPRSVESCKSPKENNCNTIENDILYEQ